MRQLGPHPAACSKRLKTTSAVKSTLFLFFLFALNVLADDTELPTLISREYRVPPAFFTWMNPTKMPVGWEKQPREFLTRSGVPFRPTSSLIYVPSSGKFMAYQPMAYHKAFQKLVVQWRKHGDKQAPDPKVLQALRDATVPPTD